MGRSEFNARRVEQLVQHLIDCCARGENVNFDAVAAANPELMPELGVRLQLLRAIDEAQGRAALLSPQPEGPAMRSDGDLQFLRLALADYETIERIDRGGQGVVYKALHRTTNRPVAIKVLLDGVFASPKHKLRFQREAELVARLRHPNIAMIFDSGELEGRPFLVMEYVEGLSIDEYVRTNALTVRPIVVMFQKVCAAVSAAHQNGIIHRDLKPSNILVDLDGAPHVLDFGLAKDLWPDRAEAALSVTGQVLGTLPYLSPEQAGGASQAIDVRSDIYALGVVFYQLLSDRMPYPVDGSREQTLHNIRDREPQSLRTHRRSKGGGDGATALANSIPDDLEHIVFKALEKDPSRRYQSAASLSDDLGRFLRGDAVEAKGTSGLYLLRKTLRRYRVQVGVASAFLFLLIVSVVGLGVLWFRAERIAQIAMTGMNMASLLKVGSVERDAGRLDQAMTLYQSAIETAGVLGSSDPIIHRQLFDAHYRAASLYLAQANIEMALKHAETARTLAKSMVESQPTDPEAQQQLALALGLTAQLHVEQGSPEQALAQCRNAIAIHRRQLQAQPNNHSLRDYLAYTLGLAGQCARKLERMAEAREAYDESLSIYQQLANEDPENIGHQVNLAKIENKLGIWNMEQRTMAGYEAASQYLAQAKDRIVRLRGHPESSQRAWSIDTLADGIEANQAVLKRRLDRSSSAIP